MANILLHCSNQRLVDKCSNALADVHQLTEIDQLSEHLVADLVIIGCECMESQQGIQNLIRASDAFFLVMGEQWPEERQVEAVLSSAAGYFDVSEADALLLKAVENILKGDIWLQRSLIPRVIKSVVEKAVPQESIEQNNARALLETLSKREMDVANMIASGKSNKRIANQLYISERTVKAHLTSIFKKLNVADRLHLAIFLKETG